jgi:uncharacterized protein involved in exopolysaccharide biosynthesis/Mrp family chromosome partitioning ATPase
MNQATNTTPAPGLDFGDILFILFRHKWKILGISTLGILGAAALYLFWPIPYKSEAKLFIKYVVDTRAPVQGAGNEPRVGMPSERTGESVINTEIEILTSLDLAQQAATGLSADVLLKVAGSTNVAIAAGLIRKNLLCDVSRQSDVIHVLFKHKDPEVVQPVLKQLIDTYLIKHAEIHRSIGVYDDYLTKESDQLKSRLVATEEELRKAKRAVGIFSLEESRTSHSEQLNKIQQDIMDTGAQLEQRKAEVGAMSKLFPAVASPGPDPLVASNLSAGARAVAGLNPLSATNLAAVVAPAPVPTGIADDYKRVCARLESLNKMEQDLSLYLTPGSPRVKAVRAQIAENEKAKQKLEDENPGLLAVNTPEAKTLVPGTDHTQASSAQTSLIAQIATLSGLESRLRVLTNQVQTVRKEADVVADVEGTITDLERQRRMEEEEYSNFQKNLEELRADEQLAATRNSNIIPIQTPSPPLRDAGKLIKAVAMVLAGGIAGAFALAFALELYLDPSVKRPIEVERRLHLPLLLSIPRLRLNGKASRRALAAASAALLPEKSAEPAGPALDAPAGPRATRTSLPILPWDCRHPLRCYQDALRDRLITYFEVKNLTHKPKLVALTSCGEGSGVTTIAAGLAASLSETGEGNVLFVDMNEEGSTHQFYRGNLACGLEDALEPERRDTALVQENLYVVRENQNGDKLPRSLPKHFRHLVSKLKASDYDYIIFDMPPISQISVTSRLARYMDIALVVVEAEETDREVVKRASSFLAQSGANLGVVLNKTCTYGPKRLQHEL